MFRSNQVSFFYRLGLALPSTCTNWFTFEALSFQLGDLVRKGRNLIKVMISLANAQSGAAFRLLRDTWYGATFSSD